MIGAKYTDLKEVDVNILNRAIESAGVACVDNVNLIFEHSNAVNSSIAMWKVRISPHCTTHLKYHHCMPHGTGFSLNDALIEFSDACNMLGDRGDE